MTASDGPRYQAGTAYETLGGTFVWIERVSPLGQWVGRGVDTISGQVTITSHYQRRGDAVAALSRVIPQAARALDDS